MKAAAVNTVIAVIARDLLALAQTILEDDSISVNDKVGRNTLKDSALKSDIQTKVQATGDPVINALFNNYIVFIEWTRPPRYKKKPPISALKDWAANNGIPTDASTLWAISHAIWRDGHAGRPIFATIDNNTDALFNDDWSDRLMEALTNDLDLLFND